MHAEISKRGHMVLGDNNDMDRPVGTGVVKGENFVSFANHVNGRVLWNGLFAIKIAHG